MSLFLNFLSRPIRFFGRGLAAPFLPQFIHPAACAHPVTPEFHSPRLRSWAYHHSFALQKHFSGQKKYARVRAGVLFSAQSNSLRAIRASILPGVSSQGPDRVLF